MPRSLPVFYCHLQLNTSLFLSTSSVTPPCNFFACHAGLKGHQGTCSDNSEGSISILCLIIDTRCLLRNIYNFQTNSAPQSLLIALPFLVLLTSFERFLLYFAARRAIDMRYAAKQTKQGELSLKKAAGRDDMCSARLACFTRENGEALLRSLDPMQFVAAK